MYTTFEKVGKDLRITLTADGRAELGAWRAEQQDKRARQTKYQVSDLSIFYDLIEHHLCNGWDLITPEEIGALTSNPYILTDDVEHDDHGDLVRCGTVYAFDMYQIRDPLEDLETFGFVVFTGYSE